MPRKGVKIKELAEELGVTSRTVIDRCRAAGIFVQNSVTRLTPRDVERVLALFSGSAVTLEGSKMDDNRVAGDGTRPPS